jgi:hypothetical protein
MKRLSTLPRVILDHMIFPLRRFLIEHDYATIETFAERGLHVYWLSYAAIKI